jgi:hypothetical protein
MVASNESPDRRGRGAARLSLALGLFAIMTLTACNNANARAQPMPTVPPQPTPDRTVDAVVRGIVTIPLPTTTRPTATRAIAEPTIGTTQPAQSRATATGGVAPRTLAPTEATLPVVPTAAGTAGARTVPRDPLQPAGAATGSSPTRADPAVVPTRLTTPVATAGANPQPRATTGGVIIPGIQPGIQRADPTGAPLHVTIIPQPVPRER